MNKLEENRKQIDLIDKKMIDLFKERMHLVKEIKEYKKNNNIDVLDKSREIELKNNNIAYLNDSELKEYYDELLEVILKVSKDYQSK